MYFPATGFIAPLLRECEPRRLFNIISSAKYIIPQQILVYLQTEIYRERSERRRRGEGEGQPKTREGWIHVFVSPSK